MEITSNLYGRKMKLYGANGHATSYDINEVISAFSNATFLREIDSGLAIYQSVIPLSSGALFSYDNISPSAIFNEEFAQMLDSNVSGWQQMTILYDLENYTGKVPLSEFLGLFPHKVALQTYGYNMYFVTDDDMDGVQAFRVGSNDWDWGFSKSTGRSAACHYTNLVIIGGSTYPTMISCYFQFIYPNLLTGTGYRMLGSGTDQMKNQVWLSNIMTNTPFDYMTGYDEGYAPDDDPYSGDDDDDQSSEGGGDGDHDDDSDNVDTDPLPSISAVDTGFLTLYNPNAGQLQSLANYMWSSAFDINTFQKLWADPMTCILGLSIIPVAIPNGALTQVKIGNISTNVSMTKAGAQYVELDCGSVSVSEYWGSYLDYSPYTKAEIYLPYCGTHAIDIDDIMKKTISIKYKIDILTGSCTANIKCGSELLYTFQGNCASNVPINGNDWTNTINGALNVAASIGTMVATGGATAPMAAGSIASAAVNNLKPHVEKSGAISTAGGLLANQKPYIIITRPRIARPGYQNQFMGYPSFITKNIGELSGYTEIEVSHISGISATDAELQEIETLLKEGVIL